MEINLQIHSYNLIHVGDPFKEIMTPTPGLMVWLTFFNITTLHDSFFFPFLFFLFDFCLILNVIAVEVTGSQFTIEARMGNM